jgi:hypothetical protein
MTRNRACKSSKTGGDVNGTGGSSDTGQGECSSAEPGSENTAVLLNKTMEVEDGKRAGWRDTFASSVKLR